MYKRQGASNHIGAAHFAKEAGIQVTHVPFGGSTDMISALRGDHVTATVAKISEVASLVKSGELKILASFTDQRLEGFEDVPTLTESGYPVIFGSARAIVAQMCIRDSSLGSPYPDIFFLAYFFFF